MNKVVVHYLDGRIIKGTTVDFVLPYDVFHVGVLGADPSDPPMEIAIPDLKAVFFVKDFTGDPLHVESNEFDGPGSPTEVRLRVVFQDGETLVGTTTGYSPNRPGFFFETADPTSNIERCYIVQSATVEVAVL